MPDPRLLLKGLMNLGRAIDARISSSTNRMVLRKASQSPTVPLSQGGYPGASGQGVTPVVPETWVESLQVTGEAPQLSGALVLDSGGETTITQSGNAPHFTISSPVFSATDGVVRNGNEFSSDSTVVRTSGDQYIGGVKDFATFPLTPATAPSTDYQAANKKYVDDRDAACQLWRRTGTELSPVHAGDALQVSGAIAVAGDAVTTDALALQVTGESQPRFAVQLDGDMRWGLGSLPDTSLARQAAGVLAVGNGNAFRTGKYCEYELCISAPDAPDAGRARVFHKADARTYSIGSGGIVHDLSVAHKQTFPAVGGPQGDVLLLLEEHVAYPVSAILPLDFNISGNTECSWSAGPGPAELGAACLKLEWTSAAQDETITTGAQVAVSTVCHRYGRSADVRARLCVNEPQRFSALYLSLNDTDGHSAETNNLVSLLTPDVWHEALFGHIDLSNWTGSLNLVLTAQGTVSVDDVGATQLCLECLSLEQWVK